MTTGDIEALLRVTNPDYRGHAVPDVAIGTVEAPVGPLSVAVTARGVVACSYEGEAVLAERLSSAVSAFIGPDARRMDPVRRELDAYFAGRLHQFSSPVDSRLISQFGRAVCQTVSTIPYGQTAGVPEIAERIGRPNALRAVVNALVSNPVCVVIPCHRVIPGHDPADIGDYAGGPEAKAFLLRLESTPAPVIS